MARRGGREGERDGQNVELVYRRLREAIITGRLGPGEVASQVLLARNLGVSRTPLREAMRLLQREGLVTIQPNRRVRIARFSFDDAEELYLMRIALEAVAIRITIPALGSEDFAELEGLLAQMEHYMRAHDLDRMELPHRQFHEKFVEAAGARVTAALRDLFDHAKRYRQSYVTAEPAGFPVRAAEHRAMVAAAAAGDAERAIERMARHYARTAGVVIRELGPGHEPVRLRTAIATLAPGALVVLDEACEVGLTGPPHPDPPPRGEREPLPQGRGEVRPRGGREA
jgi:DNA-binding GntR family transcriptional regulator